MSNHSNLTPGQTYYLQRLQQQQQQQQQQVQQQQHHRQMAAAQQASQYYNMRPPVPNMGHPPPRPVIPQDAYPPVQFKHLPFFEKKHDLIRPSLLAPNNSNSRNQELTFQFKLTNQQAADLAENREIIPQVKNEWYYQAQLRIVAYKMEGEQEDHYPNNLSIKVNQRQVQLPNPIPSRVQNKEPVRPSRPLNITPLIKICPFVMNLITVNWTHEFNSADFFIMKVDLVKKLTSDDLLARLRKKGVKPLEHTTKIIREKLSETDLDIATDTLPVNLACPLSRSRMNVPCRASTCTHLQCFDGVTFLQMNEKKQTWLCPVCNKPCLYNDLFIDGYFLQVLDTYKTGNEILLRKDGSWIPCNAAQEAVVKVATSSMNNISIVCLDDDDDDTPSSTATSTTPVDVKPNISIPPVVPVPIATGPPPEPEIVDLD